MTMTTTHTYTMTLEERALQAMCDRTPVSAGGFVGFIDAIYESKKEPGTRRVRVSEPNGRPHYVGVEEVSYR